MSVPAQSGMSIVGTWHLASWTAVDADGREHEPFGPRPSGVLVYGPDGWMATVINPTGRSPAPEVSSADCIAYAGRYVLGTDTVTHIVAVSCRSSWAGSRQVRAVEIDASGNVLTLSSGIIEAGGVAGRHRLVWRREPTGDGASRDAG